jgi:mRNA-degrading endonuclease RelE of RelBE toxin-antitoxin system
MEEDPMSGDIRKLGGTTRPLWQRRVGEYRVVFSVSNERHLVIVEQITRRSSQNYERLP